MLILRGFLLAAGVCASSACGQTKGASAEGAVDLERAAPVSLASDPLAAQADSLVRVGRPWRATLLVAPRLRAPASASPELRLAAARAAAGWDGWAEVDRVLRDAPWLDTQFGGEGRALLARSALERGQDAIGDARRALDDARDEPSRVMRRVVLARAYDRANTRDSAAAAYASAADRLPTVADWLRLRAAGAIADSAARAAYFGRVSGAAARARIGFTDAQARERTGDFTGAARVYRSVGDEGSAFRAEALGARDDQGKAALVQRIVAHLARSRDGADTRQVIDVLDQTGVRLAPAQELVVARAAGERGTAARAVAGFERAGAASLSAPDRLAYGSALLRAGRAADAVRQLALVTGDPNVGAAASYQRARALLQAGDGAGARAALRAIPTAFANARTTGAQALLLLADLQMDDGDVAAAGATLADLLGRYPDAAQAPLARFRAGLVAWNTDPARAAAMFDTLALRNPTDEEAIAARYWAARSRERMGQHADAERRWREIIAASPLSYYAQLSALRLGAPRWTVPAGPDTVGRIASVDAALARAAALDRLGMDVESRFELDALFDRAEKQPAEAAAIAVALAGAGQPSRALRVAVRVLDKGTPSRALLRAAYPVVHADALVDESRRNGLDPALVAGLIRQESSFNPHAVSVAGARGLMQLMPSVGASIASSRGYPLWTPALLFDPDVSLELGTSHLASSLKAGTPPARALAAYNAGGSRVARWIRRPGADDPELFAEWIPYTETRDYVRVVQRNAGIYAVLYDWGRR